MFCVIRYALDKQVYVVPSEYIFPAFNKEDHFPLSRYSMWTGKTEFCSVPSTNMIVQLRAEASKTMTQGMFYPSIVLGNYDTYEEARKVADSRSTRAKKVDEDMFTKYIPIPAAIQLAKCTLLTAETPSTSKCGTFDVEFDIVNDPEDVITDAELLEITMAQEECEVAVDSIINMSDCEVLGNIENFKVLASDENVSYKDLLNNFDVTTAENLTISNEETLKDYGALVADCLSVSQYEEADFFQCFPHASGVRDYKSMFKMLLELANQDFSKVAEMLNNCEDLKTSAENRADELETEVEKLKGLIAENNETALEKEIWQLKSLLEAKDKEIKDLGNVVLSKLMVSYESSMIPSTSALNTPSTTLTSQFGEMAAATTESSTAKTNPKRKYKKSEIYLCPDDRTPDGKCREPVFFNSPQVSSLTAATVKEYHELVGPSAPSDKEFVYRCLEKAFGKVLQTHTIRGKEKILSGSTVKIPINRLDPATVHYIHSQLIERVFAVGLNADDRDFRSSEKRFKGFVHMCSDKEKKKKLYGDKKKGEAAGKELHDENRSDTDEDDHED